MATCSAEYAACLGYNPWNNGTFATPTACSHQPGKPTVTLPVNVPTGPQTVPVVPSSTTGTGNSPVPVPTGGAGQLAPYGVAAAAAFMALL
jgi:hypothetical protein